MMLDVLNLRRREDAQCTQYTRRANGWRCCVGGVEAWVAVTYLCLNNNNNNNNNNQYLRLHGNVVTTHFMGVPTLKDSKEGAEEISATNETPLERLTTSSPIMVH